MNMMKKFNNLFVGEDDFEEVEELKNDSDDDDFEDLDI